MSLAGGDVSPYPEFNDLLHGYVTALDRDVANFLETFSDFITETRLSPDQLDHTDHGNILPN